MVYFWDIKQLKIDIGHLTMKHLLRKWSFQVPAYNNLLYNKLIQSRTDDFKTKY
jgi:hypothetical protein